MKLLINLKRIKRSFQISEHMRKRFIQNYASSSPGYIKRRQYANICQVARWMSDKRHNERTLYCSPAPPFFANFARPYKYPLFRTNGIHIGKHTPTQILIRLP